VPKGSGQRWTPAHHTVSFRWWKLEADLAPRRSGRKHQVLDGSNEALNCRVVSFPQDLTFFGSHMKHEIGGEPFAVTFYLFIQPLDEYAIELGEFFVEDFLLAQYQDSGPRTTGATRRFGILMSMTFLFLRSQVVISNHDTHRRP
jgi:hypothetical protein